MFFGKLTITRSVLVLKSRKTTMFHALNYKTIILLVQIPIVLVAEPSCCASVVPQKLLLEDVAGVLNGVIGHDHAKGTHGSRGRRVGFYCGLP